MVLGPSNTLFGGSAIAFLYTGFIYNTTVLENGTNETTVDLDVVLIADWVIEYSCLAPTPAQQIPSIFNLTPTQNCSTLFNYYFGNDIYDAFGDSLPQQYQNISEIEL